jgi:hypothetical protein
MMLARNGLELKGMILTPQSKPELQEDYMNIGSISLPVLGFGDEDEEN